MIDIFKNLYFRELKTPNFWVYNIEKNIRKLQNLLIFR